MTAYTDTELINLCLKGDHDHFEELVNRYKNLVYSIILKKTRNHDEANDLAQDVFLKAYKNLHSYTPEFRFSTWIMRITSNHIIDQHRKRRLETVSYEELAEAGVNVGMSDTLENEYLQQEQSNRINKIINGLPEIYKTPVVLYHQNGLSYQEIADEIGEPISKIKNRIFRGRKMLKGIILEGEQA